MIFVNRSNFRCTINRITNINNLYVSDNITILNEFKKGLSISNDYNKLFDDQVNNQISTPILIIFLSFLRSMRLLYNISPRFPLRSETL